MCIYRICKYLDRKWRGKGLSGTKGQGTHACSRAHQNGGYTREKQSNGHAHALANTYTHRTRDKTSVSNRYERMGIKTEGERDHRGHEQKHTHPDTLGGRNNDGEKRSEKEPLSKEGMHENTSTEMTQRGGTNTQQTAKEERRGEE